MRESDLTRVVCLLGSIIDHLSPCVPDALRQASVSQQVVATPKAMEPTPLVFSRFCHKEAHIARLLSSFNNTCKISSLFYWPY